MTGQVRSLTPLRLPTEPFQYYHCLSRRGSAAHTLINCRLPQTTIKMYLRFVTVDRGSAQAEQTTVTSAYLKVE